MKEGEYRWKADKLVKEWIEILERPRVIRRTPGVDEDIPHPVALLYSNKVGICSFILNLPPGKAHLKHGHMDEAVFYILKGKGYEIRDGVRYDWEAGNAVIVPPGGNVHQHFNADPEQPAKAVVFFAGPPYDSVCLMADGLVESAYGLTPDEVYSGQIFREGSV